MSDKDSAAAKDDKKQRVLSPTERMQALNEAKAKGLPSGWTVEWNVKKKCREWTSPDGTWKCNGIPKAVAWCVKQGILPKDKLPNSHNPDIKKDKARTLSEKEIEKAMKDAKEKGLPEGWTVIFDTEKNCRMWVSPDGTKRCNGIPKALAASVKMGLLPESKMPANYNYKDRKRDKRTLSETEIQSAMRDAKSKGLPEGWTVEWDAQKRCRVWTSPNGKRKCNGIPKALAVSVQMGLLPQDKMPASYRKRNQEREWSSKEVEESMAEAKARGLPDGWTVEWDPAKRCRMWISPDGNRRCNGIPKALAWSVKKGILPANKMPSSYKRNPKANRVLTEEEVEASLKEAKARGLPDGWQVVWDNKKHEKAWLWQTPKENRRCNGIPKALAVSVKLGLIPEEKMPASYRKRKKPEGGDGEDGDDDQSNKKAAVQVSAEV